MLWPHRGRIAAGSAALLLLTAADLAMPYLFKVAVDRAVVIGDLAALDLVALACLGLVGVRVVALRVQVLSVATAGQRTLATIRHTLFAHLLRQPVAFHHRERAGGIVARMTGDVDATAGLVSAGLAELVSSSVTVLGVAAVLVVLDWRLAVATLIVTPLLAVALAWFRSRSGTAWRRVRQAASAVTTALQEAIAGVRAIQAHRRESAVLGTLAAVHDEARRASRRTIVQGAVFFPGVEFVSALATAVVIGFGGPRVIAGELSVGTLTAFLLYLTILFGPVFTLSELYDTVQAAMAGAERIGGALATRPAIRDCDTPLPLPRPRGEIRLEGACFAYPDADGAPGPQVLHDVDLHMPAGATVALVGATGAGKSTVARLILRFHDPGAGRVTLDGLDLRDIRLTELRRAVGFVPQEGYLFSGSVLDNIRLGRPDADRDEIALAVTTLDAWPLIERLPAGLDTQVGERGDQLASGERQIVAFLRAWITDPAVLVLDEATSHLDPDADRCVRQALRRLRKHRTTVFIAHRLSSVLDADLVAVVADGRVVETGPPQALLDRDGHFAALYRRWADSAET